VLIDKLYYRPMGWAGPATANVPDIYSDAFARDPYPIYRVMREQFPVLLDSVSGRYLVSTHADVSRVLRGEKFSTRAYDQVVEPVYGPTLMQLSGRQHSRSRRHVTPLFAAASLRELFEPAITRVVGRLVGRFSPRGQIELVSAFTAWFGIGVVADVLGLGIENEPLILDWYTRILAYQFNLTGDPFVASDGLEAAAQARSFLSELVASRRRSPGDDAISRLMGVRVDGDGLDDEQITSFCVLLLVAGSETTDKATASLVKNLLEHPAQLEQVRRDRQLIANALAETLRYSPPLHLIVRTAEQECVLSGVSIPAGAEVLCVVGSANRDERVFGEPDRFDIHRSDNPVATAFTAAANHSGFGWGRHFCAGSRLAAIEVQIAIGALLDALPDVRFAPGFVAREEGLWGRAPRRLELAFDAGDP
jgi:cytochrome P450